MNTIDIVLGILLIIAFFLGLRKGLIMGLASLIGVVIAVYGALYFSGFAKGYLMDWFDWNEGTTTFAAFVVTFLLIMLVFSLLGRILTKVADLAMLGIINKLFGGIFNMLKYAFLISVVFMFVNASENYRILSEEQRNNSLLYAPIASLAPMILPKILKEVETINDEEQMEEAQETSL